MTSLAADRPNPADRFKQCPLCGEWFSLGDILRNPIIKPIGMLLEEADPELNFYYFNHEVPGCGTTFVIGVDELRGVTRPDLEQDRLDGADACPARCLRRLEHGPCDGTCYYAPYRRLLRQLQAIRRVPAE